VYSINALHHFDDRSAHFAEARRVLRPGGGILTIGLDPHTGKDRWFIYDFLFPGTLLMSSGGKPAGQKEPDPANSVLLHSCQTLTPETDDTTHYFFQQSHRADAGDAAVTDGIFQSLITAFNEDRDMITAQHQAIRRNPGAPMLPLGIDAALVRYRRLLEETIARESA